MKITNVEFKARVKDIDAYERQLLSLSPEFKGLDHQVDTYFKAPHGRLKLREGNIENALIQYQRENVAGMKQSDVILYRHQPDPSLKKILETQFGILKIVDKQRKIYFIDNVKFHFDKVAGLGDFIEVEVIDTKGNTPIDELRAECDKWSRYFEIKKEQYLDVSYSDML